MLWSCSYHGNLICLLNFFLQKDLIGAMLWTFDYLGEVNHINALHNNDEVDIRIGRRLWEAHRHFILHSIWRGWTPKFQKVRDIVEYCHLRKKPVTIGCDGNAHHLLWGSTDVNPRGECLIEYLLSSNLNFLNQCNERNFVVCNWQEVIDIKLETHKTGNLVRYWHVSDHRSYRITDIYALQFVTLQYLKLLIVILRIRIGSLAKTT
jgi:hypothetical protein